MPRRTFELVLQHLRRTAAPESGQLATDGALLARFVDQRDQQAFAELMRRHGSMVLGVARNVLSDSHEAEDVYQAVFLVLARSAPLIRKRDSLASWLYGVTLRVAMRARRRSLTRRQREQARAVPERGEENMDPARDEIRQALVQEIERLPQKYREPIVLCYIEGRTHEEAAQHLRHPVGTIKWRLAQARERLKQKLEAKKLAGTAGAIAAALAATDLRAAVNPSLERATLQAVLNLATGQTGTSAAQSLADAALRDLLQQRLLKRLGLGVVTLCLLTGVGLIAWPSAREVDPPTDAQQLPATPTAERPRPPVLRASGAQQARFDLGTDIQQVAIAPDGSFVASIGGNGAQLWDVAKGQKTKEVIGRGNFVAVNRSFAVAVAPDSRQVAVAGLNPFASGGASSVGVTLIDVPSGKVQVLPNAGNVSLLSFAPDSSKLLTCVDLQLVVWNTRTRQPMQRLTIASPANSKPTVVTNVTLTGDGKYALAATTAGVYRWDLVAGGPCQLLNFPGSSNVTRITAFSADGRYLAWASNTSVEVADLPAGKVIATLPIQRAHRLALAADGRQLAYVTFAIKDFRQPMARQPDEDVIRVVAVPGGEELARCRGHEGYVYGLAFRADGKVLATGSVDRSVRLWDLQLLSAQP